MTDRLSPPISAGEAALAVRGLGRLLRFDPAFAACFDLSPAGARRSLHLAWMLAPFGLAALVLGLAPPPGAALAAAWRVWAGAAIAYAIAWALPPLVFLLLARPLDREREMLGLIAVYNWLAAALTLLFFLLALTARLGLPALAGPAQILLFYGAFVIEAVALRRLLRLSWLGAAALVLLDFMLGRLSLIPFLLTAFQ